MTGTNRKQSRATYTMFKYLEYFCIQEVEMYEMTFSRVNEDKIEKKIIIIIRVIIIIKVVENDRHKILWS